MRVIYGLVIVSIIDIKIYNFIYIVITKGSW